MLDDLFAIFWVFPLLVVCSAFYSFVDIINVMQYNERVGSPPFFRSFEFGGIVIGPGFYLLFSDWRLINDCCNETALFSPPYRFVVYVLIAICILAYYISTLRSHILPPLTEVIVNILLVMGLILCIIISIHSRDLFFWFIGTPCVLFFFTSQIIINHRRILEEMTDENMKSVGFLSKFCLQLLRSPMLIKFPLLLLLCIPVLLFLSLALYLTGQKPDAFIRAFTETYRHGFSQWDYQCENVKCGDHYLCSVAANGHMSVVKPVRIGKRHGHYIICNRQLLVSNAFEELIQEKCPAFHRIIRKQYDKVGDMVHRNYNVYSKKWVADMVYVIMKPAEWAFLLVLYLADRKPEQRIARQYAPWN